MEASHFILRIILTGWCLTTSLHTCVSHTSECEIATNAQPFLCSAIMFTPSHLVYTGPVSAISLLTGYTRRHFNQNVCL